MQSYPPPPAFFKSFHSAMPPHLRFACVSPNDLLSQDLPRKTCLPPPHGYRDLCAIPPHPPCRMDLSPPETSTIHRKIQLRPLPYAANNSHFIPTASCSATHSTCILSHPLGGDCQPLLKVHPPPLFPRRSAMISIQSSYGVSLVCVYPSGDQPAGANPHFERQLTAKHSALKDSFSGSSHPNKTNTSTAIQSSGPGSPISTTNGLSVPSEKLSQRSSVNSYPSSMLPSSTPHPSYFPLQHPFTG